MDSLFGDASTAVGTPGVRSETGSLVRAGSPVPSLDLRGRPLESDDNIPPLDVDPPAVHIVDGKVQLRSTSRGSQGRVGDWLSRMVGQTRSSSSSPAGGARYAPLDQREE
jgi:hypothetical protein